MKRLFTITVLAGLLLPAFHLPAQGKISFENEIVPLLAKRCLECHNARDEKGGLDLSTRKAALSGGDSGHIIALLSDLEQRGLLDSTLVVWGGEFGRMPFSEGKNAPGRNHNPYGFCMWMAGGGVKGGMSYGETDEFGFEAAVNRTHVHDIHATMLHLMGLDHERLTYFHQGREESLTDVHGKVVKEILA